MKKIFLAALLTATVALSFSFTNDHSPAPLPICAAINKALPDVTNGYASLKGELIDKNDDGSENYTLKIAFDGFSSNQYVTSEDGGYLELYNEHPTKAKALAQHSAVAKQLETCLVVKGELINQEGLDRLQIFKKNGSEIVLIVTTTATKSILIMTIEKESKED